ncbi:MAG: hypothetical protein KGL59_10330 [Acidobacteriota bacterium]|nr:hypothetical protein [Acidobacteriota bacterium]
MDIKKKVVLIAVCAELVAMGALWFGRGRHAAKEAAAAKPAVTAPAPATTETPPATHRVSAFSNHPFSADVTIVTKTAQFHHIQQRPQTAPAGDLSVSYHGKMYAGRDALRTDMAMGRGVTASVIVRYDKGVSWTLMPGNHYIEGPIDERNDLLSALRDPGAKVTKQDLGPETVGSYPCEKYKVDVTSRGKTQSGWIWVAEAKYLDGFIVKSQDAASKQSISLSDIQLKTPPESLFDLAAGYHKLTEPPQQAAPTHK